MDKAMMAALVVATLSLAACGKADETRTAPARTATEVRPRKIIVNQPVEDAMASIPPRLREPYQAAFRCEADRSKAEGRSIDVTPGYVRDLTRRLREDPGIARC